MVFEVWATDPWSQNIFRGVCDPKTILVIILTHYVDISLDGAEQWVTAGACAQSGSGAKAYQQSTYASFLCICSLLFKNVPAEAVKIISHLKSWPQGPMDHTLKITGPAKHRERPQQWEVDVTVGKARWWPVTCACFPTNLFSLVFTL